jgi:hypothetical protein
LKKVWANENGKLASSDLITFEMPRMDAEERKK